MPLAYRVLGLVVLASLAVAACSSDNGKPGSSSGTPVATEPTDATDAGGEAAVDAATSTKKKNGELCTKADECESNLCFVGGVQSYCTVKCTPADAPTTCVAPLTGSCNSKGYCKRD